MMNIGEAARATSVSAKMIRYYESIGLLPKAGRSSSGYRTYGHTELHDLRFIRRARDLGFGIEEIRKLLDLWRDRERSNTEVKAIAQRHVRELEQKIADLTAMRGALSHLAECCAGDGRPHCPILEELGS